MDKLSVPEILHSKRNRLFLRMRQALAFSRGSYRETGFSDEQRRARLARFEPEAVALWAFTEDRHDFRRFQPRLDLAVYEKNLLTLWTLDQFLAPGITGQVLEAGSQDFARLPALATFFARPVHGIELDPFPVLRGFHSRMDKARYYRSLVDDSEYTGADFFRWQGAADVLVVFYPFVSPHPALAWGIPAEFGASEPWLESIERVLKPGGSALVVHQGPWEEEDFDLARASFPGLELEKRAVAQCPFSLQPYPPHASLYRKRPLC